MFYDNYGNLYISNKKRIYQNYIKKKKTDNDIYSTRKKWIPKTVYAKNFLFNKLIDKKTNSRYISILGHLHHGKSTLVNVISSSVHLINEKSLFQEFSDFFYLEKQRGITLQSSVTTLLLCDNKGKSSIFGLIDCPGHLDFFDQSLIGIKVSDGALIIIDVIEGVLIGTELSLRNCIIEGLSLIIILNAIDRLIIDYNYSPKKAHIKMIRIIDELNSILEEIILKSNLKNTQTIKFFNPIYNNVCFASFLQGWSFTLKQFSELYVSSQPSVSLSIKDLSLKFWNNFYYEESKYFSKKKKKITKNTMFIKFILEPLYKLTFLSITEPILHIQKFLEIELGLFGVNQAELLLNQKKLLMTCFSLFFGGCRHSKLIQNHSGLISSVLQHVPHFCKTLTYKKSFFKKTIGINSIGYIYKFCPSRENNNFYAFARILKGSLKNKTFVSVITEGHKFYLNQNFHLISQIKEIFLPIGRYNISISHISYCSIVLIKGIDKIIRKSCIFFNGHYKFKSIKKFYFSFIKSLISIGLYNSVFLCIKPLFRFHLQKLYSSLRKCCKIYSKLNCQTDELGNLIIYGPGELYLDCVLHDTRLVFENIDIKATDPSSILKESIESEIKINQLFIANDLNIKIFKNFTTLNEIYSHTKNELIPMKKKKFSFNYWKSLKTSIDSGMIAKKFENYTFNCKMKANSIWFFGPKSPLCSSCCLLGKFDNKKISYHFKDKLNQSFNLAVNEGPLLFEPLYKIGFEIKNTSRNFNLLLKNENFSSDIKKSIHEIFLQKNPLIYETYCFSELKLPFKFFKNVAKFIKIKNGHIFSWNFLNEEDVFIIRFNISLTKLIQLNSEIEYFTNKNVYISAILDNWRKTK